MLSVVVKLTKRNEEQRPALQAHFTPLCYQPHSQGNADYDSTPRQGPPTVDRRLQPAALHTHYGEAESVARSGGGGAAKGPRTSGGGRNGGGAGATAGVQPGGKQRKRNAGGGGIVRGERKGSLFLGFEDGGGTAA